MRYSKYIIAAILCTAAHNSFAEDNVTQPIDLELHDTQVKQATEFIPVNEEGKMKIAEDDKGIFTVVWENDIFSGTDANYTNGVRLAWLSSEKDQFDAVNWIAKNLLPGSDSTAANNRINISAGQKIYTPRDLTQRTLIPNDRPYAGHTYLGLGIVSDTGKTYDNAQLTIGMVGPASGAEPTQKFVHQIIDAQDPKGWDNQLGNEPTIGLAYERKWRNLYEISPFGLGADMTPHVGFSLGNVDTYASTGATFRLGYDLPSDYGPPRIRPALPGSDFFLPTKDLGGYLFAAVEGRAVARNIFLDGNTFKDSHSVDKENFVGNIQTGVALTWGDNRLSYTHVFSSREFEEQTHPEQFGVVSYSRRF